jgi:hypothetical protein
VIRAARCALFALLFAALPLGAQTERVVTVTVRNYSISGLVTQLPEAKTPRYGIALFPGSPGIMRLRLEDGETKYELRGNFLVRSRQHWLDEETVIVVVDAPSDQWTSFYHWFREEPRYGANVAALLQEVARQTGVGDWTFVGTSEGSVSAFHAARMNPGLARRAVLTASQFTPGRSGAALSAANWEMFPARLLWVHHADDPCEYTSYRDAQRYAEKTKAPLVTVRGGGPGRGRACEPFTAHGFIGLERETVLAMRDWVKTGVVPPDLGR